MRSLIDSERFQIHFFSLQIIALLQIQSGDIKQPSRDPRMFWPQQLFKNLLRSNQQWLRAAIITGNGVVVSQKTQSLCDQKVIFTQDSLTNLKSARQRRTRL